MFDPAASVPSQPYAAKGNSNFTGESYFDLIAIAQAVDAARDTFTMIELGAGYGYWLMEGAALARQRRGLRIHLIGVEAEPGHYAMMQKHFRNNNIDPADHALIHAAVAPQDGTVRFSTGHSLEWWGQSIVPPGVDPQYADFPQQQVVEMKSVSLQTLLNDLDRVDVLHMDVQGCELEVLQTAFASVNDKVGTLIVGTHSHAIESGLRELFAAWTNAYDYALAQTYETEFGTVVFGDGLQIWRNPEWQRGIETK